MMNLMPRAGTRCLRWLLLSAAVAYLSLSSASAQEALRQDEKNKLAAFLAGTTQDSPELKEICDKAARWYATELTKSSNAGAVRGSNWYVNDLSQKFGLPAHNSPGATPDFYSKHADRKPFVDAFGKSLVTALEGPATQGGNEVVRINATRMLGEVGRAGYDGAAEVFLKIIAKPDENDAVKLYAFQGLKNLFAIVPEPPKDSDRGIPEKTIFQKDNSGRPSPLETKCILALIDSVFRQPAQMKTEGAAADNGGGEANAGQSAPSNPQDADALFYVRREAVRALALVRVQRVSEKGTIVAQPALALLRIARGDGLNPPSNTPQGVDWRSAGERFEALIGFCNLVPSPRADRDLNTDYAVYQVGRALQELAPLYKFNNKDTSTPWRVMALRLREALNFWNDRSKDAAGVLDKDLIGKLLVIVDQDILKPIEQNDPAALPNPAALDQWLKANLPKNKSLFKNDEKSIIRIP